MGTPFQKMEVERYFDQSSDQWIDFLGKNLTRNHVFFRKKGGPVNRPIIHGGFNGTSTIMADFQLPCLITGW